MSKRYDQAYFEQWYHDPERRVITPAAVARKVRLTLGVAEALLERPVRTVLDVGCGEGAWREHLRRERPSLRYTGVESSEYVVERFGRSRDIRAGSFGSLATMDLDGPYDLIVVCDVLQYVPDAELGPGLAAVAELLGGVAFLEAYTTDDAIEGDRIGWHNRSAAQYARRFAQAGLVGVGMHCWVGEVLHDSTAALERRA
ncbi:MAG: class I SAM-dependent methyltransferase [Gemmatimonadaceae bacterium]|nr:class I SAM-dependent methyltransferase [Gemmatimonadaceae bacterium]MCW5826211.1 class I SAM-dependent methyltransferase [Gemmatimonadaceae bacterium]